MAFVAADLPGTQWALKSSASAGPEVMDKCFRFMQIWHRLRAARKQRRAHIECKSTSRTKRSAAGKRPLRRIPGRVPTSHGGDSEEARRMILALPGRAACAENVWLPVHRDRWIDGGRLQ